MFEVCDDSTVSPPHPNEGCWYCTQRIALKGFAVTEAQSVHFTHHVASGDPLADRVMLWTRLLPGDGAMRAVRCRWEIAPTAEFTTLIASGTATAIPERDYTVKVDAHGLAPGQSYCYRFVAEGVTSPVGCTRTLPVGDVSEFKLGVASCSNYPQGFFHAYRERLRLSSMPYCTWVITFTNTQWANT